MSGNINKKIKSETDSLKTQIPNVPRSLTRRSRSVRLTSAVLLLVLFAALLTLITACDSEETSVESGPYHELYIAQIVYDEQSGELNAIIGFSGDESACIDGVYARYDGETFKDGVWYYKTEASYTFPYAELYPAVRNKIDNDAAYEEFRGYSRLNLTARYATLYKHIESNGEIFKSGRVYVHELTLTDEGSELYLQRRTPNTANWYTVLIACGLILAAAAVGAAIAIKRSKWLTEKEK